MSSVTRDQKLRLIQQIRSRYHEDQYDLSDRERIIYGKSVDQMPQDMKPVFSTFKIRLVLALLLGAAVISMDRNGIKIAGITSDQIFQAISADFEDNIERAADAMSRNYTSH